VNILVDAGLVDKNWEKQSYHGIEADTVVVFAVRNDNPSTSRAGLTSSSPASRS
jgi:ABC-type sulfate transport system substrate-binding protein